MVTSIVSPMERDNPRPGRTSTEIRGYATSRDIPDFTNRPDAQEMFRTFLENGGEITKLSDSEPSRIGRKSIFNRWIKSLRKEES